MWFLPVGCEFIPPRRVPGEAGATPRAPTRPERTTTARGPGTRVDGSTAPESETPPRPPHHRDLRVSVCSQGLRVSLTPEPSALRVSGEGCRRRENVCRHHGVERADRVRPGRAAARGRARGDADGAGPGARERGWRRVLGPGAWGGGCRWARGARRRHPPR